MKLSNAIKKLERNGFKVEKSETMPNKYYATKEGLRDYITLHVQDDRLIIVDSRRKGQEDDPMTDYHAGTFCDNLSQAIRMTNS